MSQTEAIIFLSRFQSYKVALLKLCEKRSRIFVGIASSIFCCENLGRKLQLRTFARNFFNIDFSLQILPLKDDELVMSEM